MTRANAQRWGAVSQTLHWLILLLLLVLCVVVLTMGDLPRTPKYFWVYTAHKSLGITVLRPFKFVGLFEMPKLVAPNEHLRHLPHSAHEWGLYVLIVLVALHAGAAFYHHLFQGDATLARMLPRGWLRVSAQPKDA